MGTGGLKTVFGALVAVGLVWGNPASASLVLYGSLTNAGGGNKTYDPADDRGSFSCLSCDGLLSTQVAATVSNSTNIPDPSTAGGFSSTNADLFSLKNASDATELAFVNGVVDPDFASGIKTDTGGATSFTFTSFAEYILLKIGTEPNYALIHNTSGGAQEYTYSAFTGEGAGLSHIVEFGGNLPEPGLLALLGAGLVSLGAVARRRRLMHKS